MNHIDKYAWHYKPFDMLRQKLDKIIKLLEEINSKLDKKD
jgi:hypothetical protein